MSVLDHMGFLDAAEDRASFFHRLAYLFPASDPRYRLVEQAYNDAKDAFRGVYRDDDETRYFEHVRAVALILVDHLRVKDPTVIVAALLHDVVEDVPSWSLDRVRQEYGDDVALLVDYLTKPDIAGFPSKAARDRAYHQRFEAAPRAFFLVKLADRFHNLYTLWTCTPEKRRRKIAETRAHYLPYAERELILLHETEAQLKVLEAATREPDAAPTAA